jgi:hypothetical protein
VRRDGVLLRRELEVTLRAPLTWWVAVLSALLVGHGFVLAVDLFSAASRSVASSTLLAREMDPLAGVVRPALGGLYLAVALLAPLVGARGVSVEKERRTFDGLVIQAGGPGPVLRAKLAAALAGGALMLAAPALLLGAWLALGGHLAPLETLTALSGHALHLLWIVALAFAAACFARTFAQAVAATLVVVVASWAIDASEGFAALAWLGAFLRFSVSSQLEPFERGLVPLSGVLFFGLLATAAFVAAHRRPVALAFAVLALAASGMHRAWDATETQRLSLPPDAVTRLRALDVPLELVVELDRDDARRHQLERDFLTRVRLARPDVTVTFPTDSRTPAEAEHAPDYGRITVIAGARRETLSAGERELTTLVLEAAGQPPPSFERPDYPGYPLVVEGASRTAALLWAYLFVPALLALLGWRVCRVPARRAS